MRFAKFLIRSNLFIAGAAVVFLLGMSLLLNVDYLPLSHQLLVYAATFWIYNLNVFLQHLAGRQHRGNSRLRWQRLYKEPMFFLLLSTAAIASYSIWDLTLGELIWLAHLGLISLLYNFPYFQKHTRLWQLRSIPLLKIFLIAYVWTGMGVGLNALYYRLPIQQLCLSALGTFCFILAITLPFDIRDYRADQRFRLLTVPGWLGIAATRYLALTLLLIFGILYATLLPAPAFLILSWVPAAALICFTGPDRPWWYFTGLLDGCLLLLTLSIYLSVS